MKDLYKNFNNNDDRFLSLHYRCQNDIVITRKFFINIITLISLRKDYFTDLVSTLLLGYPKKAISLDYFGTYWNVEILTRRKLYRLTLGPSNCNILK